MRLPDIPPRYGKMPECRDPECGHEVVTKPHVPKREGTHTRKQEGLPDRKRKGFPDGAPVRRR